MSDPNEFQHDTIRNGVEIIWRTYPHNLNLKTLIYWRGPGYYRCKDTYSKNRGTLEQWYKVAEPHEPTPHRAQLAQVWSDII